MRKHLKRKRGEKYKDKEQMPRRGLKRLRERQGNDTYRERGQELEMKISREKEGGIKRDG